MSAAAPVERETHPCPACRGRMVVRVAGVWCPRCRGWERTYLKPQGEVVRYLWRGDK